MCRRLCTLDKGPFKTYINTTLTGPQMSSEFYYLPALQFVRSDTLQNTIETILRILKNILAP